MNKHTYIKQTKTIAARQEREHGKSMLLLLACLLVIFVACSVTAARMSSPEQPQSQTSTVVITSAK